MKQVIPLLGLGLLLFGFTNCANGKKLQGETPVPFDQAYYSSWTGGQKDAASGFTLFLPVELDTQVQLDSVYFRGRKAVIEKSAAEPNLFLAYFKISSEEERQKDVIMHVDPKKEYGNKPPQLPEKIPFTLEEGEAVIRYTRNGKVNYLKITGIEKKDSVGVEIKRPENIRH
jgi:hypothetical protein